MGIYKLSEMTWVDVEELDKQKSIVLVPVSPIEEHGPHLPLGTDLFGATDMAREAARRINEMNLGYHMVLAPPIPLGCSDTTADFPGTISLRGQTLYNVVLDVCTALTNAGFIRVAITNHHLDLVHMKAMLLAAEDASERSNAHVFETAGYIFYGGMATEEDQFIREMGIDTRREVHADVRETSFILHGYPHLVKKDFDQMEPVLFDIRAKIKEGLRTFKQMGAGLGYIGSPHRASEALGRLHLEEGARLVADLILRAMRNEPMPAFNPTMKKILDEHVRLD
jgi:creatinine amidohydrolase